MLDRYCCFARTRHSSKNRDLNLKCETLLCFTFLILCKAHFVALKIFTQGIRSSETITKKLPTCYYLRGCQKYPCKKKKKKSPHFLLDAWNLTVVIHSVVLMVDIFLQVRKEEGRTTQPQDHYVVLSFSLCFSMLFVKTYWCFQMVYWNPAIPSIYYVFPNLLKGDFLRSSWMKLKGCWQLGFWTELTKESNYQLYVPVHWISWEPTERKIRLPFSDHSFVSKCSCIKGFWKIIFRI